MNIVLNTNIVSLHMVPLALALKRLVGTQNTKYVFSSYPRDTSRSKAEYQRLDGIAVDATNDATVVKRMCSDADCLLENVRDFDMMEERAKRRKPTLYVSERWFKPIRLDSPRHSEYAKGWGVSISGFMKMMFPFAIKRAVKIVRLMDAEDNKFVYLANGIHAAKDMARLCGLMNGDLRCLFRPPDLDFERKPGGKVWLKNGGNGKKYCLDKMRMWGYYVVPSRKNALPVQEPADTMRNEIRVLWVGRLLNWKRVDTIVRAVSAHANLKRLDTSLPKITLDIYGTGPDESRLRNMAKMHSDVIRFYPSITNAEVRRAMREHDVYILSSDSFEGWGAVVNEALEEGMKVIGTYEAGASATILPESNLFHAGDWVRLKELLEGRIERVGIGSWTPESAAKAFMSIAKELVA